MEAHILHGFAAGFYGKHLRVVVSGYLRRGRHYPGVVFRTRAKAGGYLGFTPFQGGS